MPAQSSSLSQRFSAALAGKIVGLWPEETKQWGRAFEAELPEITTPLASVRWVLGGGILLAKETLRSFMKSLWRPLGVPASDGSSSLPDGSGPTPRLPRVFAGIFLLGSLAMLCLPEVRASLASSVLLSRLGVEEYMHQRNIQRLRREARTNHDPQLLAFLSLALSYDAGHFQLADEAIRRDPSLTWIDYSEAWWNYQDPDRGRFLSDERIERLQKFDPQNGAPYLLTAEVSSHPVKSAYYDNLHRSALNDTESWELQVARDPAWLAAMDRVFSAPEFHDYSATQLALVRQVSERYRLSAQDVTDALFPDFWDYSNIKAYSRFLTERGDEAARNRKWAAAVQDYEKIEKFAEKCAKEEESGGWFAADIGSKVAPKLQAALEASGQTTEAQIAAAQSAQWSETITARRLKIRQRAPFSWRGPFDPWDGSAPSPWLRVEGAGFLINLAVLFILAAFPLTMAALFSAGSAASFSRRILGRFYRVVCWAADAAPILLLCSFALLLVAYYPYASRLQNGASREDIVAAAMVTGALPRPVGILVFNLLYIRSRYYFWMGLTAVLSAVVLALLYRWCENGAFLTEMSNWKFHSEERREKVMVSGSYTRPGTGSLHPVAIKVAVQRRLGEHAPYNVSER